MLENELWERQSCSLDNFGGRWLNSVKDKLLGGRQSRTQELTIMEGSSQ